MVDSCILISPQEVSRASRVEIRELRAWKTSERTLPASMPRTFAISACCQRLELGHQKRCPLRLRQATEVRDERPEVLAPLDLVVQPVEPGALAVKPRTVLAHPPGSQQRQAAVSRDREQPGLHGEVAVGRDELAIRRHERVLDRILRVFATPRQMPAERQDGRVVTLVQRFEGKLVAATDGGDEARVTALRPESVPSEGHGPIMELVEDVASGV